ncbi:MAG: hypothetical protein MHM6MM_002388 [Cercozoa sp. M6MM]
MPIPISASDLASALLHTRPTESKLSPSRPLSDLMPRVNSDVPESGVVRNLLVIDYSFEWKAAFESSKLANGDRLRVRQCEWRQLHLVGGIDSCVAMIEKEGQEEEKFPVDFCLFRNFPMSLHDQDFRQQLLTLQVANVPGVNSPASLWQLSHRALSHGLLAQTCVPVIPLRWFPNNQSPGGAADQIAHLLPLGETERGHSWRFPLVLKSGSADGGYGKVKVSDEAQLRDVVGTLRLTRLPFSLEPCLSIRSEYRLQAIGQNVICYERVSTTSWKNNTGNVRFAHREVLPRHREWCASVQKVLKIDMFALDVAVLDDETEVILEVNDSAFGLWWQRSAEDRQQIRDLVLQRMQETFNPKSS